jgi:hypothetical protein
MESLLKLTGGAQKLQFIIKAKNLQINKGDGLQLDAPTIQGMINDLMGGVLPSNRSQNAQLTLPRALELDEEDKRIMMIAEADKKPSKVINAQP